MDLTQNLNIRIRLWYSPLTHTANSIQSLWGSYYSHVLSKSRSFAPVSQPPSSGPRTGSVRANSQNPADCWPPWVLGLCKVSSGVMEGDTWDLPSGSSSTHRSNRKWNHMQVKWMYKLSCVNIYIIFCFNRGEGALNNDSPRYGEMFKKWYASVLWGSSAFLQWC